MKSVLIILSFLLLAADAAAGDKTVIERPDAAPLSVQEGVARMISAGVPGKIADAVQPLYKLSLNKYYVDEIYEATIINPIHKTSDFFLRRFFDVWIIDGFANGLARLFKNILSEGLRRVQSGIVNA